MIVPVLRIPIVRLLTWLLCWALRQGQVVKKGQVVCFLETLGTQQPVEVTIRLLVAASIPGIARDLLIKMLHFDFITTIRLLHWIWSNYCIEYHRMWNTWRYGLGLDRVSVKSIASTACVHVQESCLNLLHVGVNIPRERQFVKLVNSFWAFSLLQADIDGKVEKVLFKDGGLCFLFTWFSLWMLDLSLMKIYTRLLWFFCINFSFWPGRVFLIDSVFFLSAEPVGYGDRLIAIRPWLLESLE